MVCTKCKIDKPIDQYGTYYHSVQKKTRTRKYCKSCYSQQQKLAKLNMKKKPQQETPVPVIPEDFSKNHDYKKCSDCKTYKPKTQFYSSKIGYLSPCCKLCSKERSAERGMKHKESNGGSLVVKIKPNTYIDELQKENTFEIMQLMGYLFNEEFGIWWKPGWKEIVDGKPVFLKIKKRKRNINKINSITPEEHKQIIDLYYEKKKTVSFIARKLNRSKTSIKYKIVQYEQTHKTGGC